MNILVINAGSSSLKYQLFNMADESVLAKGLCERIGIDGHLKHTAVVTGSVFDEDMPLPTHSEAIAAVIEKLLSPEYGVISDLGQISAVGHRVVHGGETFSGSVLINGEVMQALSDCAALAPLHNPANIIGINACTAVMGKVPQVAVFDTAFHQTMPPKAYTYAIPYEYYEKYKIRRYGFHGTSHKYVASRAAAMLGRPASELKLISCHMGNGSSICAIDGGKSVDTSMGFTPIAGLPMGTRCGELDVSIVPFIMERENLSVQEVMDTLNKKSGVLGVSGVSSDFRDLEKAADEGNQRAELALQLFYYNVSVRIGAYAAAMGGADAIIFTAGLGENSAVARSVICEKLGYMGFFIDQEKNKLRGQEVDVSADGAPKHVLVIPTNEELVIARDTKEIVS